MVDAFQKRPPRSVFRTRREKNAKVELNLYEFSKNLRSEEPEM